MSKQAAGVERWLLPAAMAAGMALGAYGLVAPARQRVRLAPGVAALVNGKPIPRSRVMAMAASAARGKPSAELERLALEKAIDEELLVQRAIALDLLDNDRVVRNMVVRAMLEAIAAAAPLREPSEQELRRFFAHERARFRTEPRVSLRDLFVPVDGAGDAARARAAEAARELSAGVPFGEVAKRIGGRPPVELPKGLLPVGKLIQYLGPTAARVAAKLRPGEVSKPVRTTGGYHVLVAVERVAARDGDFAAHREQVLAAWRRAERERAVAAEIARLRRAATIVRGKP